MVSQVEMPQPEPQPFNLDMLAYFADGASTFEKSIEDKIIAEGINALRLGKHDMFSQADLETLFKTNSIGKQVPAGTHLLTEDTNYIRELVSTSDSITLTLDFKDGPLKGKNTHVVWSCPTENSSRRNFTRCEANIYYPPEPELNYPEGKMKVFFDIAQKGTPRFQYLVNLDGHLHHNQRELLNDVQIGGTFNPQGQILQESSYEQS